MNLGFRPVQPWCRWHGCFATEDLAVPVLEAGPHSAMLQRWACPRCRQRLRLEHLLTDRAWATLCETWAALDLVVPDRAAVRLRWARGPRADQFMREHTKHLAKAA
jgi:hypothetical protein